MIGSIAKVLVKSPEYRNQIEQMLAAIVLPEFQSPNGHMRARACWVLQAFCSVKFRNHIFLGEMIRLTANALLTDADLAVKVEAAIVLHFYLLSQHGHAYKIVKNAITAQNVGNITMQLLRIVGETEIDDVNAALQTIVIHFSQHLAPNVVIISNYLLEMCTNLMEHPNGSDDKEEMVRGLLNTIDKVYGAFEKNPVIAAKLQPHVIAFVRMILEQHWICKYFRWNPNDSQIIST